MRRFLIPCIVVGVLAAAVGGVFAATASAGEGNGLNTTQVAKLWSLDEDDYVNQTEYRKTHEGNRTAIQSLVTATDWTWSRPPDEPATWSRNDFETFANNFETNRRKSVHPSGSELRTSERGFITDAHATIFRVQTATRAYVDRNTVRTYISPTGKLTGLIDYRVSVPNDESSEEGSVSWELKDHRIDEVCVLQGRSVDTSMQNPCQNSHAKIGSGSGHTPRISYATRGFEAESTTITLAAEIEVTLEKTVKQNETETSEQCEQLQDGNGIQTECEYVTKSRWTTEKTTVQDRVTVSESLDVTIYRLRSAVKYARYPNGDLGMVVQNDLPWSGLQVGGQKAVNTAWRFYSARYPQWDYLHTETQSGQSTQKSPVRPVRTFAFPSATDRLVTWRNLSLNEMEFIDHSTREDRKSSPAEQLPQSVDMSVTQQPYTRLDSVVIRYQGEPKGVAISGLVHKTAPRTFTPGEIEQLHRSELSLSTVARNRTHATLRVSLRDARTQAPIDLRSREGFIEVQGQRVNTNATGIVLITVPADSVINAEYQPSPWWLSTGQSYVGDSDRLIVESGLLTVNELAELATQLLLILLPIGAGLFLANQLPMVNSWPPWEVLK